jgi:plasmid stabilization system protein ParE
MLISRYSDETIRDISLHYEWYVERAGEDVAARYLAAMENTRLTLCKQPDLGRLCRFRSQKLADIRSFPIEGAFGRHLVFYQILCGTLFVFRVLHGARDLPQRLLDPPKVN